MAKQILAHVAKKRIRRPNRHKKRDKVKTFFG